MVESLLDLSRVMAGKLELDLERLDVARLVESAIDVVRPDADAKEITLDVVVPDGLPSLIGDGGRLQQALGNLLSNAIILGMLLESRGAAVRTASSAAAALDAIERRRPDVLLADVGMPDEDGYSFIRRVRACERNDNGGRLPAIAVTA